MLTSPMSGWMAVVMMVTLTATAAWAADGLEALTGDDSPLRDGERIVFFGDSITEQGAGEDGYVTLMQQAIDEAQPDREVTLINRGISGHKVPDLQERLQRHVLGEQPTAVFIYIGINDVWHWDLFDNGTPKDAFEEGLLAIVERIQESGATVVLATPSVIGEKHDGSNPQDAMLEQYAAISRDVAEQTDAELCDLRKAFLDYLKAHNEDQAEQGVLTTDGVHLNAAGNELVAEQAAASLAKALHER